MSCLGRHLALIPRLSFGLPLLLPGLPLEVPDNSHHLSCILLIPWIPDIYIAPLQETYSEALSVQLGPKRNVLRSLQKEDRLFRGRHPHTHTHTHTPMHTHARAHTHTHTLLS